MNGIEEEEEEEEIGRIESRLKIIRHWHKISKALMKKEEKRRKKEKRKDWIFQTRIKSFYKDSKSGCGRANDNEWKVK